MEVSIKFVCLFVCQKPPGPVCRSRKSDIDKSDIDNDIEVSPRWRPDSQPAPLAGSSCFGPHPEVQNPC